MTIKGWIEIYLDGEIVVQCSPYYDLAEWLEDSDNEL